MSVLAAVPSASVLAVSARSASSGFWQGALTTAGIVLGDVIFILVAVFGLALLVEAMGAGFVLVKYAGGIYLLWLAFHMWRSRKQHAKNDDNSNVSAWSSFLTGLLITLGDQKAVLFYFGLLPAFVDVSALTVTDVGVIVVVTIVAVGGVKLVYAYGADRAGQALGSKLGEAINVLASATMVIAGVWVIVRA